VLIVGWSEVGANLVSELGGAAEVTILTSRLAGASAPPAGARTVDDLTDPRTLERPVDEVDPEAIVVLAGANGGVDRRGAHARAALAGMQAARASKRPTVPIIVENYSSERARRLREDDRRIRVLSKPEISAQTLLLSALDRPRLTAIEAFVGDPELRIEALRYSGETPVAFAGAHRALLEDGIATLSVSRGGAPVEIEDLFTDDLVPGDELLVVHRLGEEVHRPLLHRRHAGGDVAAAGEEHDGQAGARPRQLLL
jgi:hypothetical protein